MKTVTLARLGVIVLVAAAVVVVLRAKQAASDAPPAAPAEAAALPRLLDLGAGRCIPCKRMAPILDALREDFADRFDVVVIDISKDRDAARPYKLRVIPTQIFFDEAGAELFRHEGFYSRQDILDKWAELGYRFTPPGPAA